jgi:hypothetical protein
VREFGSPLRIGQVQETFERAGFGTLTVDGPRRIRPFPPFATLDASPSIRRHNDEFRLFLYASAHDADTFGPTSDPDQRGITWTEQFPLDERAPSYWAGSKWYENVRLSWFPAAPEVDAAFERVDAVLRRLVATAN